MVTILGQSHKHMPYAALSHVEGCTHREVTAFNLMLKLLTTGALMHLTIFLSQSHGPPGTRRHFDINDWSKLGPDVILIA